MYFISVETLLKLGFKDLSSDKNGGAYRRVLPGNILELCLYRQDGYLRLQSIRSGFTFPLKGVSNEADLRLYWKLTTGSDIETEIL